MGYFFVMVLCFILSTGCSTSKNLSTDLCSEWTFTKGIEGAAHDSGGRIFAVSYGDSEATIGVIDSGVAALHLTLPEGSTGNGIVFDTAGVMYITDYTGHNILRYDGDSLSVLSHNAAMNQPNDLAISPCGSYIYASDPNWSEGTGQLWLIDVATGASTLLYAAMGTTNGIEVSPSGDLLYVNESVQRQVWVYDIVESGLLSNKRLLVQFPDFGLDGMRCDSLGNLHITRYDKGEVVRVSPSGETLKTWQLRGKKCTNITLHNGKGYVTMADRGCFEVIDL